MRSTRTTQSLKPSSPFSKRKRPDNRPPRLSAPRTSPVLPPYHPSDGSNTDPSIATKHTPYTPSPRASILVKCFLFFEVLFFLILSEDYLTKKIGEGVCLGWEWGGGAVLECENDHGEGFVAKKGRTLIV